MAWPACAGGDVDDMRLSKLTEFRRLFFTPDSAPSLSTLRKRIDRNVIPGGTVLDGRYYVDLDGFDAAHSVRISIAARQAQRAKDPLLDGLI
jgi:hypothetical protein